MANIKTAISIEKPLFEAMSALAEELNVSRSHLFNLAARDFVQSRRNQKLLDAINEAYQESPDATEENLRAQMKARQRRIVKEPW